MLYSQELDFFSEILTNFNLPYTMLQSSEDLKALFSTFLSFPDTSKTINHTINFQEFTNHYHQKTLYRIQNFCFYFLLFRLPNTKQTTYFSIGPYVLSNGSSLNQYSIPEDVSNDITVIDDEEMLLCFVRTLVKRIFDESSSIPIKNIKIPETSDITSITENLSRTPEDPLIAIRIVEEYYHNENELMKLVSQGQWHKAEIFLNTFFEQKSFCRLYFGENTLEAQKIQSLALSTLLRKAAEAADVHPIHIENLYFQFVAKITQTNSKKDLLYLQQEIVRKYCQLVQIHSLKGYSPIIQKVLTHIASNLSGDLTLNTQANLLNINPSYLSALFKKETGTTLTEYVKHKRINHAVFLLSTSNLQIQAVAQCCGISDVNYFTKIFKKIIGKTPKEYRDKLL